jgi:hypothetical protein
VLSCTHHSHSLDPIDPSLSNHSLGSPCPQFGISSSPPGYREPDDEETSLTVVLDSLLPFIRDQESTVQLPVYLGKSVINPTAGEGEASCLHALLLKGLGRISPGLGAWA